MVPFDSGRGLCRAFRRRLYVGGLAGLHARPGHEPIRGPSFRHPDHPVNPVVNAPASSKGDRNYRKLSWKSTTYVSSKPFHHEDHEETRRATEARGEGRNAFATKERREHKERNFFLRALCALLWPDHLRFSPAIPLPCAAKTICAETEAFNLQNSEFTIQSFPLRPSAKCQRTGA